MRTGNLLDAFFSKTRQAVLAAVLLQPERRWYLRDLAGFLELSPSSLQREMAQLTEVGLLRREADGNRVYYQADPAFPILNELQSIFVKTSGIANTIRTSLEPFTSQIDVAFIFGSVARGERTAQSDVDVMIVGAVRMVDLALPLRELERNLGAPVNISLYSLSEFMEKLRLANHFLTTVMQQKKIFLKGDDNELANLVRAAAHTPARHE
ncbi:hypothetical protein CCAX7_29010 [Capsulimonas corticalis]|uniref:Uncharacterized protein n=1 Tax=Capsulimonas corticalis TaxID=2219043 RepID=A0A402CT54_9BACT|nr:nucleotidyltransferase domain-containing protein [Capsulimonas corticalis]BDI30850.1 hypothetical protein CCAX7_29010 [Capsulimonas corticalis]